MIVLGNQLTLQFAIGDMQDFLDIKNFHSMRIAENAGGLRPILRISFTVTKRKVIPYINSGNIITLKYGIDEPTSETLQFEIIGDVKSKEYRVGSKVSLLCAMYRRNFTSEVKSDFFGGYSNEMVELTAAFDGFKTHTNITRTMDKQAWYQNGMTDWEMMKYVTLRMFVDNDTFVAWGFDNNNFYYYDVKKLLKSGPKWILTVKGGGTEDPNNPIVNIGTYKCDDSCAGVNASLAGKNLTLVDYNIDSGEFSNPTYSLKSMTTMQTNAINVNDTDCRTFDYSMVTEDDHRYATQAINQNIRNNILYSSYRVHVPVTGQYRNFRLLDVVQLIPADTDKEAEGFYFITGIAKEFSQKQYTTILTLNRESANGIKGDLKGGTTK